MIILMASAVLLRCVAAKIVLCVQMLSPYPISETGFKMVAIYAESVYINDCTDYIYGCDYAYNTNCHLYLVLIDL